MTSCSAVSSPCSSRSTVGSTCGFTETTTTCAARAASALDASAFTPKRFASSARRSRRGPVTRTCDGGTRCLSKRPRIIASAMAPPPMNARRLPVRGIRGLWEGAVRPPLTGDALQGAGTGVLEREPRTAREIADGARYEDFAGRRFACEAGTEVHRHADELVSADLALAGVDTGAHLEAQRTRGLADGARAADRARGAVERGEEAVTGVVDLLAAEALQLRANGGMELFEELLPTSVAHLRCVLGRPDDVHEEHRRDHAIEVLR